MRKTCHQFKKDKKRKIINSYMANLWNINARNKKRFLFEIVFELLKRKT